MSPKDVCLFCGFTADEEEHLVMKGRKLVCLIHTTADHPRCLGIISNIEDDETPKRPKDYIDDYD